MFDVLLEKLFTVDFKKEVDEVILKQCYRLLKDVDLECLQESKFKHALKWLSAAEKNNNDAFVDERLYLLKRVLQKIGSDFSAEVDIVEISKHLLKSLKLIVLKKQSIPYDLKQLIISSHSKITQILQTTAYLEIFCEYLNALHHHQISIKIPQIFLPQVLWMATEYLKKNEYEPAKLQIIHKLLNGCFHNSITEINDICSSLAKALLAHNFPQEAMKWIEHAISPSFKSHECLPLVTWCEALLNQNEPLLCLIILKALKSLNNEPSILAELYLKVSKALLHKHPAVSAQLLLDNWALMQKSCTVNDSLNEHLKEVIRTIFICKQEVDALSLFAALIVHYKHLELDFLLEQLKNCCAFVETPLKGLNAKDSSTHALVIIGLTFFNAKGMYTIQYHLIRTLIESQKIDLISLGITKLKDQIEFLVSLRSDIDKPEMWISLSQEAIKNWHIQLKDSQNDSYEVNVLNIFSEQLIEFTTIGSFPEWDKSISIKILENALYRDLNSVELALDRILVVIETYHDDAEWLKKITPLIVQTLIEMTVRFNDYLAFLVYFAKFSSSLNHTGSIKHNKFLKQYIEKCLTHDLEDSLIRSVLLFQVSCSLTALTMQYQKKDANNKNDDCSILVNHYNQSEVHEILHFAERFMFCCPVRNYEYVISMNAKNYEIEETTTELRNDQAVKMVSKKKILNASGKDLLDYFEIFLPKDEKSHVRHFPLTRVFYQHYFIMLLESMQEWEYHKSLPELSLIFHLVTSETLILDRTHISDDTSNLFQRDSLVIDYPKAMGAFSVVINRLIAHKLYASSEKALVIIENVPQFLWKIYLEEFTDLLMEILNNNQLYPLEISRIVKLLHDLYEMNKGIPEWADKSTKVCFHFYNKLHNYQKVNIEKCPQSSQCAFLFFSQALEKGVIKKDHPEFMHYFKAQLQRINFMFSLQNGISCIINLKATLDNNQKYISEIFEHIRQSFFQIIIIKPEFLKDNIHISLALLNEGFFETNPSEHESLMRKFIEQFENQLGNGLPQLANYYSEYLFGLFPQLLCLPKKVSILLRMRLHKIISMHINVIIPLIPMPDILENNIELLLKLIEVKYFDGSESHNEIVNYYKEQFLQQFTLFCIKKEVTDDLLVATKKLFTEEEIAKANEITNIVHQPLVEIPSTL
ncbi:MAG: hypothetical protein H0U49_06085 [Parachlamydiaceae bacterium]|nr:hypothetical protein [Parachlamydiaceae bacterium]